MSNKIPLHSLVLIITKDSAKQAYMRFPKHEILTLESISFDLFGKPFDYNLKNIIQTELKRRISLKLSLGERVVILDSCNSSQDRLQFTRIAISQGATVTYLIDDFSDSDAKSGDHIANVIKENPFVILPMQNNPLADIKSKCRGITVIGDVHGDLIALRKAISWAKSRNHFVWFLGDVIDYGNNSLEVLNFVYDIVMTGEGAMILGNHERKIARWISQQEISNTRPMRLSDGNKITINALNKLSNEEKIKWIGKFKSLLSKSSLIVHLDKITFVHAAIHSYVWRSADHSSIEDYALYGEIDHGMMPDYALSYKWVEYVPKDKIVFVGHDIRSTMAPLTVTNKNGGKVVFLDTGSGKDGCLSTADLRFDISGNLQLENFNVY